MKHEPFEALHDTARRDFASDNYAGMHPRVVEALADADLNIPDTQANFVWFPLGAHAQGFAEACEQAGIPTVQFNEGETVINGANFFQVNRKDDGTRSSSSVSYLHPILDRENLDILTDHWVSEVLVDEDRRAYGVRHVADRHGRQAEIHARAEVILSAEAINTPKLLMLSGIGAAEHLADRA